VSENTFYKIRHKKTGRYSKGGTYVNAEGTNSHWGEKSGKTWDTMGKLRAHITSHINRYYGATDMSEWEVVEYKCMPTDTKMVHEIVTPKQLLLMLKA
jgi:hypothetical protein